MIISEMQHKLATWARNDQTRRFDRLLRLIANREWLAEAARIALASSGARTPGIEANSRIVMKEANIRAVDFRIFKEVDSHEATYPAGTEILTPGETSRLMYIVRKGVDAVQIHNMTIENISEGNIFGEMGIVDPQPHTARVVALTDVSLYGVTEQQFLKLISTTPTFALRVMRVLSRRARAMNSRLLETGAMNSMLLETVE